MLRCVFISLGLLLVAACAPPPKVAVEERVTISARAEAERIGGTHIRYVAPGDTLHAIAFINGLNVNEVAAWNNLDDTTKLRVGQRIRLTEPLNFVVKKPVEREVIETVEGQGVAKPLEDRTIAVESIPPQKTTQKEPRPVVTNPPVSNTQADNAVVQQPAPVDQPQAESVPPEPDTAKQVNFDVIPSNQLTWHWPTKGKVITRFANQSGQQGIDIQGNLGQAVNAVGAGEVVYVGDGLKGYGNMVIIKHNEQYLSAYAHNQETFVLEGQQVAAKQRIALLGKNNRKQNALHFQIRRDGQPVDPLKYLP